MSKKRVEVKKIEHALNSLEENHCPQISVREFVITNFERLEKLGKSLKFLHGFLHSHGIDVGTYDHFREIYSGVKRNKRNRSNKETLLATAPPTQTLIPESEKITKNTKNTSGAKNNPVGSAPPPAKTTSISSESREVNPANQANSANPTNLANLSKTAEIEKGQSVEAGKAEKPLLYGQRPILTPDGREFYIDPETGAKHFKI